MALQPAGAGTDYVSVPDRANIRAQIPFSFSAWIKRDNLADTDFIFSKRENGGFGFRILPSGSSNLIQYTHFVVSDYFSSTGVTGGTDWQHVGMTITGTTARFFNNGAQLGSNVTVAAPDAENTPVALVIGVLHDASGGTTGGGSGDVEVAEFAFWSAQLDASEMAALGKGWSPALIRPQSQTLYLPLVREAKDLRGGSASINGTVNVTAHPRVFYPKKRIPFHAAAAAGGSTVSSDGSATTTLSSESLASVPISSAGVAEQTMSGAAMAAADISLDGSATVQMSGAALADSYIAADGGAVATLEGAAVAEGFGAADISGVADMAMEGGALASAAVDAAAAGNATLSSEDDEAYRPALWKRRKGKKQIWQDDDEVIMCLKKALPGVTVRELPYQ